MGSRLPLHRHVGLQTLSSFLCCTDHFEEQGLAPPPASRGPWGAAPGPCQAAALHILCGLQRALPTRLPPRLYPTFRAQGAQALWPPGVLTLTLT